MKVITFIEFAPGKGFPDLVPLRAAETQALWELVKVGRVRAAHYLDPLTGAFLELGAASADEARGWLAELPAARTAHQRPIDPRRFRRSLGSNSGPSIPARNQRG